MAASLLLLLDDIAGVLDDVATMTKVAVQKTAGVIGDDLALNAKQVSGVAGDRELPVVWAVAKGSAFNKLVLVPAALAISWLAPWLVAPLLVVGGVYLCFEGAEKLLHRFLAAGGNHHGHGAAHGHGDTPGGDEHGRIAGAIRTDFILSAEIIVIALGVVADSPIMTRFAVLATVAAAMTVGVYGLVAAIVKLDDFGAWLALQGGGLARAVGVALVGAAPWLMRGLSVAGTAAMFLVGGGILAHAIPAVHAAVHAAVEGLVGHAERGPAWPATAATMVAEGGIGLAAGVAAALAVGMARPLVAAAGGTR